MYSVGVPSQSLDWHWDVELLLSALILLPISTPLDSCSTLDNTLVRQLIVRHIDCHQLW